MRVVIGPYPKGDRDRKISVRIDKYDTWSMDSTLAYIILPMLKQLQKDKHGAPYTDDEDVPVKLRSTSAPKKKNEYDTDKYHFKRWDWILGEMIWAFSQQNTDWEDKYCSGKHDMLWQALDKDNNPIGKPRKLSAKKTKEEKQLQKDNQLMYTMVKGPKHTFKIDHKKRDAHWARMQNGFRLFGKYYTHLWD